MSKHRIRPLYGGDCQGQPPEGTQLLRELGECVVNTPRHLFPRRWEGGTAEEKVNQSDTSNENWSRIHLYYYVSKVILVDGLTFDLHHSGVRVSIEAMR